MLKPVEKQVIWSFYNFSDLIDVFKIETWSSWGKTLARICTSLYWLCTKLFIKGSYCPGDQPGLLPWRLLGWIRSRSEILWGRAAFAGPFLVGMEKGRAEPCCLLLVNVRIKGTLAPQIPLQSPAVQFALFCRLLHPLLHDCHQRLLQLCSLSAAPQPLELQCCGVTTLRENIAALCSLCAWGHKGPAAPNLKIQGV